MSRFCNQINAIIKKLKAGNKDSFQDLFNVTYQHLKEVAYSYAADKNDCEDIVQEAYMRAFQYIQTVDTDKDGYNWLCKIVQNVAYDFSKTKLSIDYHADDPSDNPSDSIADSLIEKNALLFEVEKLPREDQRLLYLRFWENKTYRDVEKETGISKSVIQKRTMRLLDALKRNLS